MAVCLKIWTVDWPMAFCLTRGFEPRSALHHHTPKAQLFSVGLFFCSKVRWWRAPTALVF